MDEEQKRCSTCKIVRPLEEFNRRATAADGLQARCRSCSAVWYMANRVQHMANVRARNNRVRAEHAVRLGQYLLEQTCADCGEDDIRTLDFDHDDPAEKTNEVTRLVGSGLSWTHIEREIAKCTVRCANCHRRRTARMFGYWREGVEGTRREERQALAIGRLEVILQQR